MSVFAMDVKSADDGAARFPDHDPRDERCERLVHVHDVEAFSEHPTDRRWAVRIDAETRPGPTERHRYAAAERLLAAAERRGGRPVHAHVVT
jgi:hypothetical protein